jgi:hypothetical protein
MLTEALEALAAAGGTAVVQAAGTDLWATFRERVAKLLGRGHPRQTEVTLEQLDQAAATLEVIGGGSGNEADAERVRSRVEVSWQTRFTDLLEGLGPGEREEAAEGLRELVTLAQKQAQGGVSATGGAMAVGGDVAIHAESGSVAAAVIHGGVRIGNPPEPGADQG